MITVIASNKGGVGKTTCAIYLAEVWKPVQLVDLDSQDNLSNYFPGVSKRIKQSTHPIIIDTGHGVNGKTLEALVAADIVLIPVTPAAWALDGVAAVVLATRKVNSGAIIAILPNQIHYKKIM